MGEGAGRWGDGSPVGGTWRGGPQSPSQSVVILILSLLGKGEQCPSVSISVIDIY